MCWRMKAIASFSIATLLRTGFEQAPRHSKRLFSLDNRSQPGVGDQHVDANSAGLRKRGFCSSGCIL